MTDASLASQVKSIKDGQEGIVTLLNQEGETLQFECVYKESVAPSFFVMLQSGQFPADIDTHAPFSLSILDRHKETLILKARFEDLINRKTLELTAAKSLDPLSLREYFRVDIRTRIVLSYVASAGVKNPKDWKLEGQTIDLSATGVLAIFAEECRKISNIRIDITLTHPARNITCFGHLVRTRPLRNGRWHAALHFDTISSEDRDDIITTCLHEQRRQLRENIQTAD